MNITIIHTDDINYFDLYTTEIDEFKKFYGTLFRNVSEKKTSKL